MEATPTPRHRHPGDLEPADSGGIECAVSNAQRGCEKMGRAPSRSRENSGNISLCEVPVPIFSQRQRSKGRPFVSIGNARPFRPPGWGADSSRADGPGQAIEWPGRKRGQVRRTGAGLFCCVPGSLEHQPGGYGPVLDMGAFRGFRSIRWLVCCTKTRGSRADRKVGSVRTIRPRGTGSGMMRCPTR